MDENELLVRYTKYICNIEKLILLIWEIIWIHLLSTKVSDALFESGLLFDGELTTGIFGNWDSSLIYCFVMPVTKVEKRTEVDLEAHIIICKCCLTSIFVWATVGKNEFRFCILGKIEAKLFWYVDEVTLCFQVECQ